MEYPEYRDKVDCGYPVCGGSESYLMGLLEERNDEDGLRLRPSGHRFASFAVQVKAQNGKRARLGSRVWPSFRCRLIRTPRPAM